MSLLDVVIFDKTEQYHKRDVNRMILYFSGTGNSAYVAKVISEGIEDTWYSITAQIRKRSLETINSEKPLVFVTPTYAWRIPRLVQEWIEKMKFVGNKRAYFILTCGDSIGNAGKYARSLCDKKGFEYMGCKRIVMPENYVAMFPVPNEKEARKIVKAAHPVIYEAMASIKAGESFKEPKLSCRDKLSSSVVNQVFYDFIVKDKKFRVTDDCIGCGICEKVCPLHNIDLINKEPYWKGKCTHCMKCICDCPQKAIEYGRASKGKDRYHCPTDII